VKHSWQSSVNNSPCCGLAARRWLGNRIDFSLLEIKSIHFWVKYCLFSYQLEV
jgi:hypothetical protein